MCPQIAVGGLKVTSERVFAIAAAAGIKDISLRRVKDQIVISGDTLLNYPEVMSRISALAVNTVISQNGRQ